MRAGRTFRDAGHLATSRAASAVHAVRRRRDPGGWTRRDPHRIHWARPEEIVATTAERIPESQRGRVLGGDWDVTALPLTTLVLWRGLEQRIVDGRAWADTDLAAGRFVAEAPNVGGRLVTDDPRTLAERWGRLDALIDSLRRDGWVPHHDVGATFVREMSVGVSRDGSLVRNAGGLHRVIIARLIGLERIPFRILVEHPDASRA